MSTHLSLIIPAYNEEHCIARNLATVEAFLASLGKPCEVIVVDDGSSDRTAQIVRDRAAESGLLRIISYTPNRGKGYAVRQGVFAARGDYVMFSDADLSAPIDDLLRLFAAIDQGYDVAIGSRAVAGSELMLHQPRYRELGGKALNLVIRALAVRGIHDTQCGFKLFTCEAARAIFPLCFLNGWAFDVEVLYLARRMGYSIAEVPVRWGHAEGSSVEPLKAGLAAVRDIIRMRLHNYTLR